MSTDRDKEGFHVMDETVVVMEQQRTPSNLECPHICCGYACAGPFAPPFTASCSLLPGAFDPFFSWRLLSIPSSSFSFPFVVCLVSFVSSCFHAFPPTTVTVSISRVFLVHCPSTCCPAPPLDFRCEIAMNRMEPADTHWNGTTSNAIGRNDIPRIFSDSSPPMGIPRDAMTRKPRDRTCRK